jgi:hypothetical protein
VTSGPSIATLIIPPVIAALAALSGVTLSAGLSRRAQRRRQREEHYTEAIKLARRIIYLLLTRQAAAASEEAVQDQKAITEAEAEYALMIATSLRSTSAEFIRACHAFVTAMTQGSTTPRGEDLRRLVLQLPIRPTEEWIASTQALFDALVHMVEVADRDLGWGRRSSPPPAG